MNCLKRIPSAGCSRPKPAIHTILRSYAIHKLREAANYSLTIVHAGAGYGKTTLINQAFSDDWAKTVWISLSDQEKEPIPFLLHFICMVQKVLPDLDAKTAQLLIWDERQGNTDTFVILEAFMQELAVGSAKPLYIILDDFQYVNSETGILRLITQMLSLLPDNIHLVLASREKPALPELRLKQLKNEVLIISEEELAFKQPEIENLFEESHGIKIDPKIADQLFKRTEGWVMALNMIGQLMKKEGTAVPDLSSLPPNLTELFEFLAQSYLTDQPTLIRNFMVYTSYLRHLKDKDCDLILGIRNSAEILKDLATKGLFTFRVYDGYRYHELFKEFLQKMGGLPPHKLRSFHYKVAKYYKKNGEDNLAIEHFLLGGGEHEAGLLIKILYHKQLVAGRKAEVEKWLDLLTADVLNSIPELLLCRGDLYRLTGDFQRALKYYSAAERAFSSSHNERGGYLVAKAFALIYLDSVQPALAEQYLEKAFSLSENEEVQEKAKIYQLMAENQVNLGRNKKAAELFRKSNELYFQADNNDVEPRIHLRAGRLFAAKNILMRESKRGVYDVPNSYKDTPLLLSLINSLLGEVDEAWLNAQSALSAGTSSKAFIIEAVAYMRLGHAKQLKSWTTTEEAIGCYRKALELCSRVGINRVKVEALLGLCLTYGHQGRLVKALRYGTQGLSIAQEVKDEWVTVILEMAIGIAYFFGGMKEEAYSWMLRTENSSIRCGDSYLSSLSLFWQARLLLDQGNRADFKKVMETLLVTAKAYDYDFIFYKPTFLGLRDPQTAILMLSAAQQENLCPAYVSSLLSEIGEDRDSRGYPGYVLKVQTLGTFKAWRGAEEIRPQDWQREKARRLFQYLITHRKRLIHKEQIIETLWEGGSGSDNDFRVALNALINSLEPGRSRRAGSFFITKYGGAYGLKLGNEISIDIDEFEDYVARADNIVKEDPQMALELYRIALSRYKGDYLEECHFEDWCIGERERLHTVYLTSAEKAANIMFQKGETQECIRLLMRIVAEDSCWESAYRLLMKCFHRLNNHAMVAKVFKQCRDNLKTELDVHPAEETVSLFEKLTSKSV